jgi:hypothetical protein
LAPIIEEVELAIGISTPAFYGEVEILQFSPSALSLTELVILPLEFMEHARGSFRHGWISGCPTYDALLAFMKGFCRVLETDTVSVSVAGLTICEKRTGERLDIGAVVDHDVTISCAFYSMSRRAQVVGLPALGPGPAPPVAAAVAAAPRTL